VIGGAPGAGGGVCANAFAGKIPCAKKRSSDEMESAEATVEVRRGARDVTVTATATRHAATATTATARQ
jgi:hypothetical protein